MKVKLSAIILVLLIFLMFLLGCSSKYVIITWTVNEGALRKFQEELELAKLTGSEVLIKLGESSVNKVLNNPIREEFEARKIIEFTSTSVRFIDSEGKERFITADKVEIQNVIKK